MLCGRAHRAPAAGWPAQNPLEGQRIAPRPSQRARCPRREPLPSAGVEGPVLRRWRDRWPCFTSSGVAGRSGAGAQVLERRADSARASTRGSARRGPAGGRRRATRGRRRAMRPLEDAGFARTAETQDIAARAILEDLRPASTAGSRPNAAAQGAGRVRGPETLVSPTARAPKGSGCRGRGSSGSGSPIGRGEPLPTASTRVEPRQAPGVSLDVGGRRPRCVEPKGGVPSEGDVDRPSPARGPARRPARGASSRRRQRAGASAW